MDEISEKGRQSSGEAPEEVMPVDSDEGNLLDEVSVGSFKDDVEVVSLSDSDGEDSDVRIDADKIAEDEADGKISDIRYGEEEAVDELDREVSDVRNYVNEEAEDESEGDDDDSCNIVLRRSDRNKKKRKIFTYHKVGGKPLIEMK